jgi:hypothetical protein
MSGTTSSVSLQTGFVDLSSFDEVEMWLYGGACVNILRRAIVRSSWFSLVATQLSRAGATASFGGELQTFFSRSADYALHAWLRTTVPQVNYQPGVGNLAPTSFAHTTPAVVVTNYTTSSIQPLIQPRWTQRLGHNLIVSRLGQRVTTNETEFAPLLHLRLQQRGIFFCQLSFFCGSVVCFPRNAEAKRGSASFSTQPHTDTHTQLKNVGERQIKNKKRKGQKKIHQ